MSDKKNFQVKNGLSINGTQVIDGNANATFGAVTVSGREILNYTQLAFNTANGGNGLAQSSYNTANSALSTALGNVINIDYVNQYAQSAFSKANTALANTTGTFEGSLTITSNVYADKIYTNGLYWAANGNVISTGGSTGVNQFNIYKYLATAGQTVFSGPDSASVSLNYTVDAIQVTLNGLMLKPGTDFTANDGSSIVLTVAADLNDELNIYGFTSTTVNTSNTLTTYVYVASAGQTSFGGVDANGNTLEYLPGNLFTTVNGITLKNGVDYTAANGSYINLTFSAAANDEVNIYAFGAFNIADTYTTSQADAKFTTAGKSLAMNFFRS